MFLKSPSYRILSCTYCAEGIKKSSENEKLRLFGTKGLSDVQAAKLHYRMYGGVLSARFEIQLLLKDYQYKMNL
jgi:hypothetical protein